MNLSAIDDHGHPVDWWFIYKVAGKSKSSTGARFTGTEYVYFDSSMASAGKLSLSPNHVDSDGALPNTLAQLYHEEAHRPRISDGISTMTKTRSRDAPTANADTPRACSLSICKPIPPSG